MGAVRVGRVLVQARVWDDYEESWVYVDDELQEACAAIRRMCALLRSIYHDQDRVPLELLEEELQQLVESTGISRSMLKKVLRNSRHKRVPRSEIKQYPLTKRAMEKVLERYFKKLEAAAASMSQQQWGTCKQLVVFFGNAGIGTRGGWGAKAVQQACRKVVERPNSGRPTDRVPGKVVTVDEFRTSRFRKFGYIEGCRFFPGAVTPYAFIKLDTLDAAQGAISELNNTFVGGRQISVKSAEQDAEYETAINNLYCINIPLRWTEQTLSDAFSRFGHVLSLKLLPAQSGTHGKGALVRMSTVEEAKAARNALNASAPEGEEIPLVIKFADSAEEKARKRQHISQRVTSHPSSSSRFSPYSKPGLGSPSSSEARYNDSQPRDSLGGSSKGPGASSMLGLIQALSAQSGAGGGSGALAAVAAALGAGGGGGGAVSGAAGVWQQLLAGAGAGPGRQEAAPVQTGVTVTNLLPHIDRLRIYEMFGPFGGVLSVLMPQPGTASILYTDAKSAMQAIMALSRSPLLGPQATLALQPSGSLTAPGQQQQQQQQAGAGMLGGLGYQASLGGGPGASHVPDAAPLGFASPANYSSHPYSFALTQPSQQHHHSSSSSSSSKGSSTAQPSGYPGDPQAAAAAAAAAATAYYNQQYGHYYNQQLASQQTQPPAQPQQYTAAGGQQQQQQQQQQYAAAALPTLPILLPTCPSAAQHSPRLVSPLQLPV
ncbi:hypothetical protein QJQ45_014919 [Haematococcus lacustris]|nr:hypothetical protein QJQ45_014919 [Haematococcus lacustris]